MPKPAYAYAVFDGHPLLVSDMRAWLYKDGEWSRIPLADVLLDSAVVTKATFDTTFGPIPDPPADAFDE